MEHVAVNMAEVKRRPTDERTSGNQSSKALNPTGATFGEVESQAQARESIKSAREAAVERALVLFYAAYGREPMGKTEKSVRVSAWCLALEEMSPHEILEVSKAELRNRTNQFLPSPADLLKRWRGEQTFINDDGKEEKVVMANAGAYEPFEQVLERQASRSLPSGEDPAKRAEWLKLGEKLRKRGSLQVQEAKPVRLTPSTDTALGHALTTWCGMEAWRVKREKWTAFGAWLLTRYPVEEWTPEVGRNEWIIWAAEQKALNPEDWE